MKVCFRLKAGIFTAFLFGRFSMNAKKIRSLVFSAACIAIGLYLPFLTGQIPQIGSRLSPMHIPVLLCGFLCGWQYGAAAGAIMPLLRGLLFGMPPLIPTGLAMAFELAAYGAFSGILNAILPKKIGYVYLSLILSMLLGRIVWGVVTALICMADGSAFSFSMFLAGAFVNAVPGIILHIAIIPPIVLALRRANFPE